MKKRSTTTPCRLGMNEDVWDFFKSTISIFGGVSSYAQNISWQIVSFIIFIALFLWDRRNLQVSPTIFDNKGRKKLLTTLIILGSLAIVAYIITIIYSYFSGLSEPYGLVRIAVVLFVLAFGIVFSYMELMQKNIILMKTYIYCLLGTLMLGSIVSIIALQQYGSPSLMRQVREDLELSNNLKRTARETLTHYIKTETLPQHLQTLLVRQNLNESSFRKVTYKKLTSTSFEVCGVFQKDWHTARRMNPHWKNDKYQKGLNCRKHFVKKRKDGTINLEIRNKKGVMINIY